MSTQFDKDYYDRIWGNIHRHDYCEGLVDRIIQKYHPKSLLDIGAGCGWLVKVLRDKGVDAWGLEISEYAVANSHGFIRQGDIRDIPFGRQFDIVHSQGVWEYIPEEDIQRAWSECKRVGKAQEHTIDYKGSGIDEENFATAQTEQWWKNQFYEKILVACSTNIVKEYSLQRWIDNVKKFTYPNYDILVVDTSENGVLYEKYKDQVPMMTIPYYEDQYRRMCESMEAIRLHVLKNDYKRFFSVESDIIPPINVIEQMLEWGKDSDWISHAFPSKDMPDVDNDQGIGCSLLSRRLLEKFTWAGFTETPDGHLWGQVRPDQTMKVMEMWHYWKNKHLRE